MMIDFLPAGRAIYIDTNDYRLVGAMAYVSKSGQSVAVTLHAATDPRHKYGPVSPARRVYLSANETRYVEKPEHLVNLAMHKSVRWLDDVASNLWHAQVVVACRPLREKCKPLLIAIAKTARNHYGDKYWLAAGGRELLRNELRLAGVSVPPFGAVTHFLPLATV